MFLYIFISSSILYMSGATDILSNLWEEEESHLSTSLRGAAVPENENKILISHLSKLPFTDRLKSDVWYKLLRYRSVESLHLTDWQKYEPLIPYLPLSLLRKVNFTNDDILIYFGQQTLSDFQLPQLAEEAIMRSGSILDNEEEILKLGNIICGFTHKEISMIKESVLRYLLEKNFFQSIKACSAEKLAQLSKLVEKSTVIGPPRTWPPESFRQAESLKADFRPTEIREIREKSFSQNAPEDVDLVPVEILRVIKDSQLKDLNKTASHSWKRKTRDLRGLYMSRTSSCPVRISFATALTVFLSINWKGLRGDIL